MSQMNKQDAPIKRLSKPNTTPVPDVFFDEIMVKLSDAELRVMLYIIRRTYGFMKHSDAISLNQLQHGITKKNGEVLDHGCGVSNRTVLLQALVLLEAKGLIKSEKQHGNGKSKGTTIYKVCFAGEEEDSTDEDTSEKVVRNAHQGGTPSVPRGSAHNVPGGSTPSVPTRNSTTRNSATKDSVTRERDDPTVASPKQESSLSPASPALADSSSSKSDVSSSQDTAPGWNAIAFRDRFYELSGIRPRLPKQLDEDTALAAQVYQTTSEIEEVTAYTNMKADPYWKSKNLSLKTFVRHLPEYLHAPPAEVKSTGNTAPSKRSLGGPASEKPDAATNERNKQALLAKYAARQTTASQQRQTA